jgi:hypothetical protein
MFYGNFFTENWHEKRSEELISQTKSRNYKKVYYLGFGAIDGGMVNFINQGIELTLSDNYEDAFTVATICLNELVKCDIVRSDWQSYVIFEINDMNQLSPIEGQDLIVALDAIEHANDPGSVLKEISTIPSDVYLSVPVCKKLPFHNQDWATVNDSHTWVTDFGYTLISTKSIYMGAKDTFASGLNLIEEQIYAKH